MTCMSFAAVNAALIFSSDNPQLRCIGLSHRNDSNKPGCARPLAMNRLLDAKHILVATTPNYKREDIRDLICLVLCWKCQKNDYRRKDEIELAWQEDFPGLGLNSPQERTRRRPSPHSLWHKAQPEGELQVLDPSDPGLSLPDNMPDVDMTTPEVPQLGRVVTRSQTARIKTSYFRPGKRNLSAPWTLRNETLELLSKSIPPTSTKYPNGGSIYAVRVGHFQSSARYVKIGITKRDTRQRLQDVEREHGICLDIDSRNWDHLDLSGPVLERLEKVVFKDLAFCQKDLVTEDGRRPRIHGEYFEIDFASAWETIKLFRKIMDDNGLKAGTSMDSASLSALRTNPALNFDVALGPEQCRLMNADHQNRMAFWNAIFRLDRKFDMEPLPCTQSPGWFWTSKWLLGKAGSVTSITVTCFGKWVTAVANV